MQWIFVGICFFSTIAASVFAKSQDLNAGLTVAIVLPLVFLAIYSLARIKPKEHKVEEGGNQSCMAEISEEHP